MIYFLIFLSLGILSIFNDYIEDNVNKKIFYGITIFFIIFAGIRYDVGHDWWSYFNIHASDSWHLKSGDFIEPTFTIISKLSKIIIKDYEISFQLLIAIYSVLTFTIYGYVINRFSDNKYLSLFILYPMYIITTCLGQIRYGAAIAICLLSVKYIKEKNLKKYLITSIIAIAFHITAIIYLPTYFLINIKIDKKNKIRFFIFSLIVGVFINPFSILKTINDNFMHMPYISEKLNMYELGGISIISLSFIIIIFTYILSEYICKNNKDENTLLRTLTDILYWGVIFYIISNRIEIVAFRGSNYYFIFEILIIPILIKEIIKNKQYNKYLKVALIILVLISVYRFIINFVFWYDQYVPYRVFLFK